MTALELYIPPERLRVRILALNTNKVLFYKDGLNQYAGEPYDDQLWRIVPGSGEKAGLYLIKHDRTGKVLYVRGSHPDGLTGCIDGDGYYEDNWFRFEPGQGQYRGLFRLFGVRDRMVLVARGHREPYITAHPADAVYGDQYFSFRFPDMKVKSVVYDVDAGQISQTVPVMIARQSLINNSSSEQTSEFTYAEKRSQQHSFEYSAGFSITVEAKVTIGLPEIGLGGEISTSVTRSQDFKWGVSTEVEKTFENTIPVKVPAKTTIIATATVTQSTITVPFTLTQTPLDDDDDIEVVTKGVYRGVTFWDIRYQFDDA